MAEPNDTALITGASAGIGEALAWEFAEHGHDLILVARSGRSLAELAEALVEEHGVRVNVRPTDLSVPGAAGELADELRREGEEIGILVNNAGVLVQGPFVEMAPEDHQRMVQLNVAGLTDMLANFLPDMAERGSGRVLNVASMASFVPAPTLATYAATKAYILSLSEALVEELRDSGVTVTTLCPGFTETNMLSDTRSAAKKLPRFMVGDAEEVARSGYRACMAGAAIEVPGNLNLAETLVSRSLPKWLVRRLMGLVGRTFTEQ